MGRKLYALIEIAIVFILILSVPMLIVPEMFSLFPGYLGGNVLGHNPYTFYCHVIYLAIFLIIMAVTRIDISRFGILTQNIGRDLKVAAICFITIGIIPWTVNFLPLSIFGIVGLEYTILGWTIQLLMLFITALILYSVPGKEDKVAIGTLIIIPAMLLPTPGDAMTIVQILIMDFILYVLLVGPIEELVFRGYIQSRLNDAFGRPHRFFGVNWGIGIVIASLLFGLIHVTGYNCNLLTGSYSLDWLFGISSFFFGLAMGFIREKTGNITASSIVHGADNFFMSIISYL